MQRCIKQVWLSEWRKIMTRHQNCFLQEAEVIYTAYPEDDLRIAANLYEQAYVNMKIGVLDKAEEIMNRSLEHAKKSGDAMCIGCAYRGLGEIMKACGNTEQTHNYFEQAITAFELTGDSIAVDEVKAMLVGKQENMLDVLKNNKDQS